MEFDESPSDARRILARLEMSTTTIGNLHARLDQHNEEIRYLKRDRALLIAACVEFILFYTAGKVRIGFLASLFAFDRELVWLGMISAFLLTMMRQKFGHQHGVVFGVYIMCCLGRFFLYLAHFLY